MPPGGSPTATTCSANEWFVLTSASGKILWYQQVSTSGWPSQAALVRQVTAALARAPKAQTGATSPAQELAGSPAPLAALHAQASRLIGAQAALSARIRALRGYPVIINAWASWCTACQAELGLFASASAFYGRRVAFLGADTDDPSPGNAQAFLSSHHVQLSQLSTTSSDLESLAVSRACRRRSSSTRPARSCSSTSGSTAPREPWTVTSPRTR